MMEMSYEWIKKKGFIFTADAISQFLDHSYFYQNRQEVGDLFWEYIVEIFYSDNVTADIPFVNGDHLVH